MKSKLKRCPLCGKKIRYPTIGWGQHQAMHERQQLAELEKKPTVYQMRIATEPWDKVVQPR